MFPFIDHVDDRHGAQPLLPWEEKTTLRRSLPQRLRLTLPPPGMPVVSVAQRPPPEPIRRAGVSWGWLARLTGRTAPRSAAV